jgi:hypothetical protein
MAALPCHGISSPRAVLYTSREPRADEVDGRDYHFRSAQFIESLPRRTFYVGPVHGMQQAVDLDQLATSLRRSDLVLIEIFDKLWPGVERAIVGRLGQGLRTASVFMTAVDPDRLQTMPDHERAAHVEAEVGCILRWRAKDPPDRIKPRAKSGAEEVLAAISPEAPYKKVFYSSPEGPDGRDEWTCVGGPVGRAADVLREFIEFVKSESAD